ncbi:MAG: aminotransferase class I/II-fold pyridoxal phosphate-dependent enzyme [Chloroflexi bacterium]|nr:aminotransferase class I/II-fold pyridoxal phosphate-dependent enzyme [Chloroflexota bacterium]
MSKAWGAYGGFITGSQTLIDEIESQANVHEGASRPPCPPLPPPPPPSACSNKMTVCAKRLQNNVQQARSGVRQLGWPLPDTPVPILCLDNRAQLDLNQIQAALFAQGILVAHSQHYTSVPAGGALRIAIFATHTPAQIERLIQALARCVAV